MPGETSKTPETFNVPTSTFDATIPTITKIDLREASAIAKMADKLEESNWTVWCEKMRRIFKVTKVLPYIDGTIPCPDKETYPEQWKIWDHNDSFAQCLITCNVSDRQMIHIGRAKTAEETWQNLSAVYVPKGHQAGTAVLRNFYDTRAKESDNIVEHLSKLKELWERLNLFGDESFQISDTTFKTHIASSLPPSWDTFTEPYVGRRVGVKETDPKKLIHSQEFIGIVKEEYLRRKSRSEREKSDQTYYSQNRPMNGKRSLEDRLQDRPSGSKSYSGPSCQNCGHPSHDTPNCWWLGKPKCNKCGFFGHLEKDCQGKGKGKKRKDVKRIEKGEPKKKKRGNDESHNVEEEIVCILQEDEEMYNYNGYNSADLNKIDERLIYYDWLADTATTSHVSNCLEAFTSFKPLKDAKVTGVGNTFAQVEGRGTIKLESQIDGQKFVIELNDVLYIPSNKQNLLSLGRWDTAGGQYIGGKGQMTLITKDGKRVAKGKKINNNLYKMDLKPQKTNKICSNNVGNNSSQSYVIVEPAQSWETWHRCLGHVGYSGIQQMVTKSLVDGLNINIKTPKPDCQACTEAKQAEEPFKKNSNSSTKPGELTHIDV